MRARSFFLSVVFVAEDSFGKDGLFAKFPFHANVFPFFFPHICTLSLIVQFPHTLLQLNISWAPFRRTTFFPFFDAPRGFIIFSLSRCCFFRILIENELPALGVNALSL